MLTILNKKKKTTFGELLEFPCFILDDSKYANLVFRKIAKYESNQTGNKHVMNAMVVNPNINENYYYFVYDAYFHDSQEVIPVRVKKLDITVEIVDEDSE